MSLEKKHTPLAIIIMGLVIAVFFATTSLIYIYSVKTAMTADAHVNVVKLAARGSGKFSSYFDEIIVQLRTLSRICGEKQLTNFAQYSSIAKNMTFANDFQAICILGKTGSGYNFSTDTNVDLQSRPSFSQVREGHDYISSPFTNKSGNEVLTVSCPIIRDGEFLGAIVAYIPLAHLSDVLLTTFNQSDPSIPEATTSFIIDSESNILFSSVKRDSRNKVEDVIGNIDTPVYINRKLTKTHFFTALSRKEVGSTEFKLRDTPMICSFKPMTVDKEWHYFIITPSSAVVETGNAIMKLSWSFVFITLLFLLLVFIVIISIKNKSNKNMIHLALYDQITGIPNWTKFKMDCTEVLKKSSYGKMALISFDVDEFKIINNLYGHKAGDDTLKFIAGQLEKSLFIGEKCARYSSNTFLMLIRFENNEDIISRIKALQQRIKTQINGYAITFSFGVYKIEEKEDTLLDIMFDRATLARNSIKGNHEVFYSFYNDDIRINFLEAKLIENEMEKALENNEFEVFYQPKISIKTGKVVGAEALVRWNHPSKGLILPDNFIPQFEQNGFVVHIDNFILVQSCKLIRKWKDDGIAPVPISVNFSRLHLRNPDFVERLFKTTKKEGVEPAFIEVELTESSIFDNKEVLTSIAAKMQRYGFALSLDDFGSGYSSLNVLNDLPVDVIKIDKLFFNRSANTARGKELVTCVINMAKKLGIVTVSEGVETVEQLNFLKDVGCDIAQGYYFAHALSTYDFQEYYKNDFTK